MLLGGLLELFFKIKNKGGTETFDSTTDSLEALRDKIDTLIAGINVAQKGVEFTVVFPIYKTDGTLITGATGLDSEISKDHGTFIDCTNEAIEIATTSGWYYLVLTATEMNADIIAVMVKTTSTSAIVPTIIIYTK